MTKFLHNSVHEIIKLMASENIETLVKHEKSISSSHLTVEGLITRFFEITASRSGFESD